MRFIAESSSRIYAHPTKHPTKLTPYKGRTTPTAAVLKLQATESLGSDSCRGMLLTLNTTRLTVLVDVRIPQSSGSSAEAAAISLLVSFELQYQVNTNSVETDLCIQNTSLGRVLADLFSGWRTELSSL